MKTVIDMAREAGLLTIGTADGSEAVYTWPKGITKELERFAELVRADERVAMATEAAKQGWAMKNEDPFEDAVREIAAIRARGTHET